MQCYSCAGSGLADGTDNACPECEGCGFMCDECGEPIADDDTDICEFCKELADEAEQEEQEEEEPSR